MATPRSQKGLAAEGVALKIYTYTQEIRVYIYIYKDVYINKTSSIN